MKLNLRFNRNGINKKWNIIRLPYRSLIFHRNCSHSLVQRFNIQRNNYQ